MKNKKLTLLVLGIIGVVVITVGVTYAFFNYAKQGTTENSVTTGTITFLYTEVDQVGAGISIEDALPTTDSVGKAQTGSGNVFNFKVTANTRGKAAIPYEVTARKKSTSTLEEEAVKIYLTEVDGTEKELLLDNYDNLTQTSKVSSDVAVEKTIYTGKVYANTLNYEKNFRLRMWVDNNIDYSDGTHNGKNFTLTVNVYANATVVTDSEVAEESNTSITSITAGEVELVPVEEETYQYEASLPEGTTSTVIEVETESPNARVDIERVDSLENISNDKTYSVKKLATSKALELNPGDNFFKVTVTSENDKIEDQYGMKITVEKSLVGFANTIYKANSLIKKSPTLTQPVNLTSDAAGLYSSNDTNNGDTTYYFRGNVNNNYVSFAGFTWRIVRINEDGTVRMIMQDGINNNTNYAYSGFKNSWYVRYSTSTARVYIDNWYNTYIVNAGYSDKIAVGNYYCQRAVTSNNPDANSDMQSPYVYVPTFECPNDSMGFGILNRGIGLITYDEAIYAGGYYGKTSDFYMYDSSANYDFWTMSPASNLTEPTVWYIYNKITTASSADSEKRLRPVINLKAEITVTGTGLINDKYIVQ